MAEYGSILVDFAVLNTEDPTLLLVCDTSVWKHIENSPSIIEITLPGGTKPITASFAKSKVNVLNSGNLGVTCTTCENDDLAELPDGIYHIKVKGSPDTYYKERYYLRTVKLKLRSDKYYISYGLDFNKDFREIRGKLLEIDLMIKAAEASIRQSNVPKAAQYYKIAKSIMEQLESCTETFE